MTLRLKQIRLTNWKCYQNQNIVFNLDTDRTIWVIFGKNGSGKTSLMEAILWCLYGSEVLLKTNIQKYFHLIGVQNNPELEMRVELNFTSQEGKNYFISRSARLKMRGSTTFVQVDEPTYNEDGQNKDNSRDYIEALLPRSCRDFFCFDGKKIDQYAQVTQTREAKQAIEKVLGIPELRNLREDADKALKDLDKRLNEASKSNQSLNQKTSELASFEEEIEIKRGQLRKAKQQEGEAIKIYYDVQERAEQIEELRHQLDQLEEKERKRIGLQIKLDSARKEVDSWLRKASIPLLLGFVQKVVDELQVKTMRTNKKSASIITLKEIIRDENCLCGRCLDASSRNYILQQIEELEQLGNITDEILEKDRLRVSLQGLLDTSFPSFDDVLIKRDRLEDELDELDQAIKRLKNETAETNQEEAREIWQKLGEWKQKVTAIQERVVRLTREIEQQEKQYENLTREIDVLASGNQTTRTLAHQVKLARGLRDATNELINWHIDNSREMITTRTSERYCQVTNKPDEYKGVEITEDYTLGIRTVTGALLDPDVLSAGEKEALAFAFITGLNQASETAAPLIMDTPFGHLDTEHQRNIINSLPQIGSQVIVLATDRDLPDSLLTLIRPHIAEILTIRRLPADQNASIIEREN